MTIAITLTFTSELNSSIQVGDDVYHTSLSSSGGFDHMLPTTAIMHVGTIASINHAAYSMVVDSPHVDIYGNLLPNVQPVPTDFITFTKNNIVNNNDLLGYYAKVEFQNNSKVKAELFSVGAEVSENSK